MYKHVILTSILCMYVQCMYIIVVFTFMLCTSMYVHCFINGGDIYISLTLGEKSKEKKEKKKNDL